MCFMAHFVTCKTSVPKFALTDLNLTKLVKSIPTSGIPDDFRSKMSGYRWKFSLIEKNLSKLSELIAQ